MFPLDWNVTRRPVVTVLLVLASIPCKLNTGMGASCSALQSNERVGRLAVSWSWAHVGFTGHRAVVRTVIHVARSPGENSA